MAELGGDESDAEKIAVIEEELKQSDMSVGATTAPVDPVAEATEAMNNAIDEARDKYDDDMDDAIDEAGASPSIDPLNPSESHPRYKTTVDLPNNNKGDYTNPIMTQQDAKPYKTTRRRKAFPDPTKKDQDDSYQQFVDIMRLYHTKSRKDVIDGMTVQTYYFDLYMCVDGKSEVRVQPYMSSQCLLLNFQPCVQEADLPMTKFIRPKSIYDNRYASVRHRHYDYERRIWELTLEVDQIWKNFDNYVKLEQGYQNAYKVMMTDKNGRVYAGQDNFERHAEPINRRVPDKVLITMSQAIQHIEGEANQLVSCIGTSDISTKELEALKGITVNIQDKFDSLEDAIDSVKQACDHIWEALGGLATAIAGAMGDFVKKPGDDMTGSLWMHYDGNTYTGPSETAETFVGVKFKSGVSGAKHGGYLYGASSKTHVGLGVQRTPGTDRDEDWAIAVTPEIDESRQVAAQFNGTHLRFADGGRVSDSGAEYFAINFKLLRDWWHSEIAPDGWGEIDA